MYVLDYWLLARDFKTGDTVQRCVVGSSRQTMSPYVGHVLAVHKGYVAVRFPYGVDRVASANLVKVHPKLANLLPPTLSTLRERTAASKQWRTTELPAGFHRDLAYLWSKSASEVAAYDGLWRRYASLGAEDQTIRDEVSKFYLVARNLFELRLRQHARKSAAYWAAANRQYRATSQDIETRKPSCPKCGTGMRKTTYKMDEGARVRLFACPKDLFLVRQTDLLGPGGEPVEW